MFFSEQQAIEIDDNDAETGNNSVSDQNFLAEDDHDGWQADVAEVYSPPRVCRLAPTMGLSPGFSADITTGTDLTTPDGQMQVWHDIDRQRPRRLLLGPPCTWYSILQNLNYHRWTEQQKAEKARVADLMFNFAVRCCEKQDDHGREFVLEHPASARSWDMPSMLALRNRPGVVRVTFDQCRLGLRDLQGRPLRKRTSIATNSPTLAHIFDNFQCNCTTPHGVIQGSQHGVKMSVYAQRYPLEMQRAPLVGL